MSATETVTPDHKLDLTGEVCPYTFVKSKLALEVMDSGQVLEVVFDHRPAVANVSRSMEGEGHEVLSKSDVGPGLWQITVRKA
jgi:tRNA 2-thiouridine synthesizing protein A